MMGIVNFYFQMALPLALFMLLSFIVLIICRVRSASPKAITAEIRKEIKNKGKYLK